MKKAIHHSRVSGVVSNNADDPLGCRDDVVVKSSNRATGTSERVSEDAASSWRSFWRLWGAPVALILVASIAVRRDWWPAEASAVMWIVGIVWIGTLCLRNARRCGRTHCWLVGVSYPVFALYALGIATGLVETGWNTFWNVFLAATILTFVPELLGMKYLGSRRQME